MTIRKPFGFASLATGLAVCCAMLAIPFAVADTRPDLVVAAHEQRELPIPSNLERIAVGDPSVADVVVVRGSGGHGGSVLIVGKKAGETTLRIWQRGSATPRIVHVTVQGDMASVLPENNGDSVNVHGNAAVISGRATSMLSHVQSAAAATDATGAKGRVLDAATIDTTGVVQVDVKVIEFSKSALKQAGFNFLVGHNNSNFSFNLLPNVTPANAAFNLLRGAFSLDASIKLLQSNGVGRVLAEPTLVALSGQSASFLAGGELPIPQSGGLGTTTIVYKPFGIGLTVTPTILSNHRIALKVAPEASDVDYTNAITTDSIQIPAITTRRADTTVELGDGESFVIGGLVSRTTTSSIDKLPVLGDLPIIGTFFRTLNYQQQEKELVIIVTPHLVKPIAKGVALPLPGQRQEQRDAPVWGDYLMGVASDSDLPGFSR